MISIHVEKYVEKSKFLQHKKIEWICIAVSIILLAGWAFSIHQGELSDKAAYAVLQFVQAKYENNTDRKSFILIENAYGTKFDVGGFLSNGNKELYYWVIFNKIAPSGRIYALPHELVNYVDCDFLQRNIRLDKTNPEVNSFLMATCKR